MSEQPRKSFLEGAISFLDQFMPEDPKEDGPVDPDDHTPNTDFTKAVHGVLMLHQQALELMSNPLKTLMKEKQDQGEDPTISKLETAENRVAKVQEILSVARRLLAATD